MSTFLADASGLNLISLCTVTVTVKASTSTGNLRLIPEKEPEKQLLVPRDAAGTELIQYKHLCEIVKRHKYLCLIGKEYRSNSIYNGEELFISFE